jgi:hypothetical protein
MSEARYDRATNESSEDLLKRALESLQQESASIQIQGRALTEEEMSRVKKIESAVELINQALAQLGS